MSRGTWWWAAVVIVVLLVAGWLWYGMWQTGTAPGVAARTTLVLGSVSSDVEGDVAEYQPLADYLARALTTYGYTGGEIVVASSVAEMGRLIREGKVDLYIDSPFPTFAVDQLTRSEPLVNRWKGGVEKYRAVIYTRADSGLAAVDDLKGRVLAFEHPQSTSGYFLPKAALLEAGYTLRAVEGPAAAVGAGEIGYFFAGEDDVLMEMVASGVAVAGAQSEVDVQEYAQERGDRYRFLLTTPFVYRHVVTVARHVDPVVREDIRDILTTLHTYEEGKTLLAAFRKTTQFTPFEPTSDAAYVGVRELLPLVEREIIGE